MGKIRDEYKTRVDQESKDRKGASQQRKIDAKIRKEQNISDADICETKLRDLMSEIRPMYEEVRKDWRTMFMLPNIRMTHIERARKEERPVLICSFGMRREKDKFGDQAKVKSSVHYDLNTNKYDLRHLVWERPHGGGGMNPPPPKAWCLRTGMVGGSNGQYDKGEVVEKIREELRQTYASNARHAPKRIGIGVATLAVIFGLSQCNDSDANEVSLEDAGSRDLPVQISEAQDDTLKHHEL